jgi:hypothetical protein
MTDTKRVYDPGKRHEYYMKTRQLKGRNKGNNPSKAQELFRAGERKFTDPGVIIKPKNGKTLNLAERLLLKENFKSRLRMMTKTEKDLQEAQKSLDQGFAQMKRDKASGKMSEEEFQFETTVMKVGQRALDEIANERAKTRVGNN